MNKKNCSAGLRWVLYALLLTGILLIAGCGKRESGSAAVPAGTSVSAASGTAAEAADSAASGSASPASEDSEAVPDLQETAVSRANIPAGSPEEEADAAGAAREDEAAEKADAAEDAAGGTEEAMPDEHGTYTSKDEVALYLHTYGHLPDNYITKKEAEKLGWNSSAGNLQKVAPGKSIGGSYFGNYEGLLPKKKGRKYYECDINYEGGYRGPERIIYSSDGLIFYTGDHYKSFEQLY